MQKNFLAFKIKDFEVFDEIFSGIEIPDSFNFKEVEDFENMELFKVLY